MKCEGSQRVYMCVDEQSTGRGMVRVDREEWLHEDHDLPYEEPKIKPPTDVQEYTTGNPKKEDS